MFSLLSKMWAICNFIGAFYQPKNISSISVLLKIFVMNGYWVVSNMCAAIGMIIWFSSLAS